MSDSCKCQCKCILVSEACIYDLSDLNAESKIVLKKPWIFDRVHDFQLEPILGKCLVELCEAKSDAIAAAEAAADGSTFKDHIDEKWLLILDNHYFRAMYSLYAEYYATKKPGNLTGDGLVEYDRSLENQTGIARSVSAKKHADAISQTLADADSYKVKFKSYLETIATQLGCFETEICKPCQEQTASPSSIGGFGKSGYNEKTDPYNRPAYPYW